MIQNWWIWHRDWEGGEDIENTSAQEIPVESDNVVTEWKKEKRKTSIERKKITITGFSSEKSQDMLSLC